MTPPTPMSRDELASRIKIKLLNHNMPPSIHTDEDDNNIIHASDQIMALVDSYVAQEVTKATTELDKAYGGCHKCYGKGYSTVKAQDIGYGTDGDIGGLQGPYKRDVPIQMKFCTCTRGKQLEALTTQQEEAK